MEINYDLLYPDYVLIEIILGYDLTRHSIRERINYGDNKFLETYYYHNNIHPVFVVVS